MSEFETKIGEAIEPLDDKNVIIQPENGYRFGADAVALAKYARKFVTKTDTVCDLCSGCRIVGILVSIATGAKIIGADIDKNMCDMAMRSAALDGLDAKFISVDLRDKNSKLFEYKNSIDVAVCNPPFYKAGSKPRAVAPMASAELTVTFADIADAARLLLKPRGKFIIVHSCSRLDEILATCRAFSLTPKNLTVNANGKTFLLCCVKGGKDGLKVETDKGV